MSPTRSGTLFGIAAYAAWGSFPLFFPLLEPAGALEVLAHRVVWSLLVVGGLLALGIASARGLRRDQVLRLAAAAVLLAVNWGTYIYGVNSGQVVETSLGYFINPLVSVALGVVVLGERLRPLQQLAIGIAFVAVLVLTAEAGHPPVIALVLAFSFGTYGLLKKQAGVGAVASLAVETAVLTPAALAYLLFLGLSGDGTFTTEGVGHALLLVSAGIVTAGPLLAFGAAATRIPLSTLGVLQYIAPSLQLICGLAVAHEAFGVPQAIGFSLVWVALVLFTSDLVRSHRAVLVPA
ncbi:MAG: protein rarD [Frankiales bacterium]|nr:protein rarD [Frankiales bacterium]